MTRIFMGQLNLWQSFSRVFKRKRGDMTHINKAAESTFGVCIHCVVKHCVMCSLTSHMHKHKNYVQVLYVDKTSATHHGAPWRGDKMTEWKGHFML